MGRRGDRRFVYVSESDGESSHPSSSSEGSESDIEDSRRRPSRGQSSRLFGWHRTEEKRRSRRWRGGYSRSQDARKTRSKRKWSRFASCALSLPTLLAIAALFAVFPRVLETPRLLERATRVIIRQEIGSTTHTHRTQRVHDGRQQSSIRFGEEVDGVNHSGTSSTDVGNGKLAQQRPLMTVNAPGRPEGGVSARQHHSRTGVRVDDTNEAGKHEDDRIYEQLANNRGNRTERAAASEDADVSGHSAGERTTEQAAQSHSTVSSRPSPQAPEMSSSESAQTQKENADTTVGKRSVNARPVEYLGSHLDNGGSMQRGVNVTRLSYAVYKIMRLFQLKSLIDYPSGAHAQWMPAMVSRLEFETPAFKYHGMDASEAKLEPIRARSSQMSMSEFSVGDPAEAVPGEADLMFHWTDLDDSERDPRSPAYAKYLSRVMQAAQRAGVVYLIVGQYPRLRGETPVYKKGKWRFMGNTKEDPFLYNEELRGVVPIQTGRSGYRLHITLFAVRTMDLSA